MIPALGTLQGSQHRSWEICPGGGVPLPDENLLERLEPGLGVRPGDDRMAGYEGYHSCRLKGVGLFHTRDRQVQ